MFDNMDSDEETMVIQDLHLENEVYSQKVDQMTKSLKKHLSEYRAASVSRSHQQESTAIATSISRSVQRSPDPSKYFMDPVVLHSQLLNSQKQLKNVERDYVSTLKKFKKVQKNPHMENELSGNIWHLDQLIAKEKQIQLEQIQSHKQIDRLQNKAIVQSRGGGHTDKTLLTDKNILLGQRYSSQIKEYQIVENACAELIKWEKTTKVNKLLDNENKIRQAQQVVEFYKKQVQQIDADIAKIIRPASATQKS